MLDLRYHSLQGHPEHLIEGSVLIALASGSVARLSATGSGASRARLLLSSRPRAGRDPDATGLGAAIVGADGVSSPSESQVNLHKRDHDMHQRMQTARELNHRWRTERRWEGIERDYSAGDVVRLRGSLHIESTLAPRGGEALAAAQLTSDIDERDRPFLTGERTPEGFFRIVGGLEVAIDRGRSYAPYADLIWCETSVPDLGDARRFAEAIHDRYPGKLLAYNCSPSFNWRARLDDATIARFQRELGAMGYKFQFITLAGFHVLNLAMFDLARAYRDGGMAAFAAGPGGGARARGQPRAITRSSTSASSAPATSTRWPRQSPPARPRRPHSTVPRSRSSSSGPVPDAARPIPSGRVSCPRPEAIDIPCSTLTPECRHPQSMSKGLQHENQSGRASGR